MRFQLFEVILMKMKPVCKCAMRILFSFFKYSPKLIRVAAKTFSECKTMLR